MLDALGVVSIKGTRERHEYLEDRYSVISDFPEDGDILGGVYDGHGGSLIAEDAMHDLPVQFRRFLLAEGNPLYAFAQAYEYISLRRRWHSAGACAADFFIRNKEIFYANAGDCRIVIIGDTYETQLTVDHRLTNDEERMRIEATKARIKNPYYYAHPQSVFDASTEASLMVTRSLGDMEFRTVGHLYTPHTGKHSIVASDRYLVAASDGLFDVISNWNVGEVARKKQVPQIIAEDLCLDALQKKSQDDITIVVLKL